MIPWGRLKDVATALLILAILAAEGALWVENPMHIPAGFIPARALGLEAFKEVDTSMKPTISPGQYVLVSSWSYWRHQPHAGDVVVFQYPRNPSLGDLKRIVAVPGSTIEMKNGVTYVDGKPEIGSNLQRYTGLTVSGPDMPAMRVPAGTYFVMGDDRDSSEDSRNYGVIRRDRILGKVIWPQRFGLDARARASETLAGRSL
ncbi:MAG TPA: signal peptidase I [Steroidobacteraceae bacterium]|nr:signal peptidase I [Steroidobacteraceae bacterium]